MNTENQPEQQLAAGGEHPGGEQRHHGRHIAQQIEEKLEHVAEEVEEIEKMVREEEHEEHHGRHHHPDKYFVEIEGVEYPWSSPTITVADIRTLGNLPADQPVIEIDPCNQERTLAEGEVIHLKPGHRYGKKVRFKRGLDRITADSSCSAVTTPPPMASGRRRRMGEDPWLPVSAGVEPRDGHIVQVPAGYPGQAPYGFCVTSGLRLKSGPLRSHTRKVLRLLFLVHGGNSRGRTIIAGKPPVIFRAAATSPTLS